MQWPGIPVTRFSSDQIFQWPGVPVTMISSDQIFQYLVLQCIVSCTCIRDHCCCEMALTAAICNIIWLEKCIAQKGTKKRSFICFCNHKSSISDYSNCLCLFSDLFSFSISRHRTTSMSVLTGIGKAIFPFSEFVTGYIFQVSNVINFLKISKVNHDSFVIQASGFLGVYGSCFCITLLGIVYIYFIPETVQR